MKTNTEYIKAKRKINNDYALHVGKLICSIIIIMFIILIIIKII